MVAVLSATSEEESHVVRKCCGRRVVEGKGISGRVSK